MIRHTSLLLVIAIALGATRLLACELSCAKFAAAHESATCHAAHGRDVMVSGSGHRCAHDVVSPAVTTPKASAVQQSATVIDGVFSRGSDHAAVWTLRVFALSPGVPFVSRSPRASVLRI